MRRGVFCVLMMSLLLGVCGCAGEEKTENALSFWQSCASCSAEIEVRCDTQDEQRCYALRCAYVRDGESVVEVLAPEELTGISARIEGKSLRIGYDSLVLDAGGVTERVSAANAPVRVMQALTQGYVLERAEAKWDDAECVYLTLDWSAGEEEEVLCHVWLREDGTPLHAEIEENGCISAFMEFTNFEFGDIIPQKMRRRARSRRISKSLTQQRGICGMETLLKRTWTEINLDNLTYNIAAIRRQVGKDVKLMGVVKADAYGHGAVRVSKHLESIGADYLAISNIDEAHELRANGIKLPMLILGASPVEQAKRIIEDDVTQAVHDLDFARKLNEVAGQMNAKIRIHIKLDTGMGRLGFQCDEPHFEKSLRDILELIKLPNLDVEGVFTHFCVADEEEAESEAFTRCQQERFVRMVKEVESKGDFTFRLHHSCNAGGIALYPEFAWDVVRCGIIMYGVGEMAEKLGMKPVMTLKTAVSAIKDFAPDTSISYGRKYFTKRESRIAVLPIGYADGLFRSLSGKLQVLTPYGFAPQVGRICMDMCMIDVTDLPQVKIGDEVEIYGEHSLCQTAAEQADTIAYELMCAVSKRVPRWYYKDGVPVDYNLQLLY